MAYKLIAIDLDDTLLTGKREIHPRAKRSILSANAAGFIVVLCTGRIIKGAQRYYDELDLDTPLITAGGALVTGKSGETLFSRGVEPTLTRSLLRFAYDNGIHAQVYVNGEIVFRERNTFTDRYEKLYGRSGVVMPDLAERLLETPKVLFALTEERLAQARESVVREFPMLSVKRSKGFFLEFSDPSVSKGSALKFVADQYGLDASEAIAVGDTEIDIPMLEFAGLGVAVANADEETKAAADIICASNEEGGVADIIYEYMLEVTDENQAENR